MSENNKDGDLYRLIECSETPNHTRILAAQVLELKRDICHLKKINKWQLGMITSILASMLIVMFELAFMNIK